LCFIIIISSSSTTIIGHQLGLVSPVSASHDCPFKVLPSRLLPVGLQFSILFAILLLFIPVTCRSKSGFIFFVSYQLVLISAIPKFLRSFCGQRGCSWLFYETFHLH
jgi:hypothetical protein